MRRGVGPTLSGPSTGKTGKPVAALGHKHPVPTRPPINMEAEMFLPERP